MSAASTTKYHKVPQPAAIPLDARDGYLNAFNNSERFMHVIRNRREELGLSRADVARAMGIKSSEFIGMIENGIRNLELNKVPRLADVLKIDPTDLCRLALFESAPLMAMSLFGVKPKDYQPRKVDKVKESEFKLTPEQAAVQMKLFGLPSSIRNTVIQLIDQFAATTKQVPQRLGSD